MRQTLLPGAERKSEDDEKETSENENGSRRADAGYGPGQLVVKRNGVIAGQQRQDRLVENQN